MTEEPLPHERGSDNDSVDSDVYDDYPNELEQEDDDPYYIEITASDSAPSRNATIPRKLESVTEISLENLSNLGPKQAQLWMLLNMQKMVQKMEKMEEVYGSNQSLPRKADRQSMTKPVPPPKPAPLLGNAKEVPAPPNYPPPEEIEEIYDEDIGPELEIVTEPTRQDLYINLDAINEAVEKAPPPPVPPRTSMKEIVTEIEHKVKFHFIIKRKCLVFQEFQASLTTMHNQWCQIRYLQIEGLWYFRGHLLRQPKIFSPQINVRFMINQYQVRRMCQLMANTHIQSFFL